MKTIFLFITAVLLVMLFTVSGCSPSGDQSLNSVLKILPDDVDYVLSVDWDKLRVDPNLNDIYDELVNDMQSDNMEEYTGINAADITLMMTARKNSTNWAILVGNFNFDDIRHAFENQNMDQSEYMGIEVWEGKDSAAAFINGMLVVTTYFDDLKDVILLNDGSGDSFYDNEYNQTAINELPAGILTYFMNMKTNEPRVVGTSIYALSADTMEFINCFIFSSEEEADSNLADIKEQMEHTSGIHNLDISQSGNMVKIKGETDKDDFGTSPLFYQMLY